MKISIEFKSHYDRVFWVDSYRKDDDGLYDITIGASVRKMDISREDAMWLMNHFLNNPNVMSVKVGV